MTLRKRLSKTNTRILLMALLALLIIGVLVIEIFEITYPEHIINYVKLEGESVEVVELLDEYDFSQNGVEKLGNQVKEYGYLIYLSKDDKVLYSDFSKRQMEEMRHLESYVTKKKSADVFVWKAATMIFKTYEAEGSTYQIVALCNTGNNVEIQPSGQTVRWLIPVFMAIGILAILIIVGISRYFRRKLEDQIMEPIDKLIDAASRIEEGNFEEPVEYEGDQEFEKLCNTFNNMQASVKESIDRAEADDQARTEMIAGMSHDLKTPLTSIKGYIKGVKDGVANTPEKQEKYLDIAYQKACAMEVLLQKLFYYSKLESGNMPMNLVKTEFGGFLFRLVEDYRGDLKERNTDIVFLAPEEPVMVEIDHDQMYRVTRNIVENSIKYRCREHVLIQMNLLVKGEEVILKITDDGEGVPEEKLPHLFEQFYRGDETRNSKIDGDGLGLYISKRIVEQHGGQIYASNRGGFCVTIVLPMVDIAQEKGVVYEGKDSDCRG